MAEGGGSTGATERRLASARATWRAASCEGATADATVGSSASQGERGTIEATQLARWWEKQAGRLRPTYRLEVVREVARIGPPPDDGICF